MPSYYYSTTAMHGEHGCHEQIRAILEHLEQWGLMYLNIFPVSSMHCMIELDGPIPGGQLDHLALTTSTST